MSFIKALFPGTLVTLIVAGLFGSNHSTGAFLHITREAAQGHTFYWSWVLFIAMTGLAWSIIAMTPR